ncbi:MAG: hypothetical protein V1804_03845 [Patescibacteria group bacterium]
MYWIYLALFVLAVLVPDIITHDRKFFFLQEEQIEEVLIFLLGLTGFIIFRWEEKQSNRYLADKIKMQKETSVISKSLTDTYSYIGETNRKLDIMKSVSMNLLEIPKMNAGEERKFFDILMESIYILAKSKKFSVRFINIKNGETGREVKSKKRVFLKVSNEEIIRNLFESNRSFFEDDYHFIITSPKEIDGIISAIIIAKNNRQQKIDDPEMLKALASHSLFLYNCSRKNYL